MKLLRAWCMVCLFAGGAGLAAPQGTVTLGPGAGSTTQAAPAATGTVAGRVFCTDTQRPAKFADVQVMLLMDVARNSGVGFRGGSPLGGGPQYNTVAQGRTALDGSFSIGGVASGDYVVVATAPGYLSPAMVARAAGTEIRGAQVHVDVNRTSSVQVSMERGAVVAGRVMFDDGTAAAGVPVALRGAGSDSVQVMGAGPGQMRIVFGGSQTTDDRGNFRISGVAPGKYNVMANLLTEGTERTQGRRSGGFPQTVTVFAPATMHRNDARVVEIRGTETVEGVDVAVALAGLHTVHGLVEARADGHPLGNGMVRLADAADGSFMRVAQIDSEGTFAVEYLPPGNYTMMVNGSDRDENGGRRNGASASVTRYKTQTAAVVVGDHDVTLDPLMLDASTP